MSSVAQIFDRNVIERKRKRSQKDALFLHRLAADMILEKLTEVNKTFTKPAIIGPFADIWAHNLPNALFVADQDILPLKPQAHDLIIHFMALHGFNDPLGQIIQAHHALKADGLFMAVCFGGQTLEALRSTLMQSELGNMGGVSPRVSPMASVQDYGALLQRAGLALPVADVFHQNVEYQSLTRLMHDLRAMGESNALCKRRKTFTPRRLFESAAMAYPQKEGRYVAGFDLIFLSAWAPHDSQPKPLRPGSAKMSLKEVLAQR